MQIQHFSDTIWYTESRELWITGKRINLWYEAIANDLWIKIDWTELVWSTYWNSFETWAQAIEHLLELNWEEWTQVILVNNADRAKHVESWDAKWSDCLLAEIEINWKKHYLVWVDDELFWFVREYSKVEDSPIKLNQIKRVKWVDYNYEWQNWENHIKIDDLSKWTQFRSKEHFPLVQLLLIKQLLEVWELSLDWDLTWLVTEDIDEETLAIENFRDRLIFLLEEDARTETPVSELATRYIEWVKTDVNTILEREYLELYEWIEEILLVWEVVWESSLLKTKLWIETDKKAEDVCWTNALRKYQEIRESLEINQIALIHRDLFWNWFFATNQQINRWINQLCGGLWVSIWDKVRISWWWKSFEVIITETISDHTWENCLWNSSGRWPWWEIILNMNKSIDSSRQKLDEIQNLPIWTILTIEKVTE